MQNTLFRPVAALLAVQMLLTACGVAAHGPGRDVWPEHKTTTAPRPRIARAP
jgi:predicted small secreted protein